jgi:hypothetical protein
MAFMGAGIDASCRRLFKPVAQSPRRLRCNAAAVNSSALTKAVQLSKASHCLPRAFSKLIALLVLLHLCGGHWNVLQTVAWVGMIVDYAEREASLPVAIEKTFDGQHPCSLCEAVKHGRDEEQKRSVAKVTVKMDAVLAAATELPEPAHTALRFSIVDEWEAPVSFPPPSPPPLAA